MKAENIAKVCHEVNKVFCESLGDYSQKSWDDLNSFDRESAVKGVQFAIENAPDAGRLHDAWIKRKTEAGWVHGTFKDPEKKTHPSLVPFNQLPEYEKTKDKLFLAVVKSLQAISPI
jgi:hypothetical protein